MVLETQPAITHKISTLYSWDPCLAHISQFGNFSLAIYFVFPKVCFISCDMFVLWENLVNFNWIFTDNETAEHLTIHFCDDENSLFKRDGIRISFSWFPGNLPGSYPSSNLKTQCFAWIILVKGWFTPRGAQGLFLSEFKSHSGWYSSYHMQCGD